MTTTPVETADFGLKRNFKRFARNKVALVGLVFLAFVAIVTILAPWIAPYDPTAQDLAARRAGPSTDAWFGRDEFGRDILSRILIGGRATLSASIGAVALAAIVGTAIGLLAGVKGGYVDNLLMRSMDLVLSFPYFLLAILIIAVAGPSLRNAAIAIGITFIPQYARVVRGAAREVTRLEYVEAARVAGMKPFPITIRHVLPNVSAPILVLTTVSMALSIVGIASLSFLGLGAQPPSPEWGAMLSAGRQYVASAPHISIFPGLAILLTVLGLNLVGDGLRDTFDPNSR